MKTKLRTCFLIILLALAGTIAWIIHDQTPHGMLSGEGDTLLKALPFSEIASITIIGPDGEVSLTKKAGRWVVKNRFDYAADFSKISDFVEKLSLAKIGRRFPIRTDIRKRLNLNQPTRAGLDDSEKGIQVLFKNKAGGVMSDILFGKARCLDGTGISDSHYVMLGKSSDVYLVDTPFATLTPFPPDWMDSPVIEAPAEEVRKIECFRPGTQTPAYVFERTIKGEDLLPIIQLNQSPLDKGVLKKIEWAITYLPMEDVLPPSIDPATIGLFESIRLDYYLFNGMIYRVFPCKPCSDTAPCYVKIEVDYQKSDPKPASVSDTSAGLPDDGLSKAKGLNAKLGNWIYEISEGRHSVLITDLDQLIK